MTSAQPRPGVADQRGPQALPPVPVMQEPEQCLA